MLSAVDANEAAVRLCLVRWHSARLVRRPPTAAESPPPDHLPLPIVLIARETAEDTAHGWLLGGLPSDSVRVVHLARSVLTDASALDSYLAESTLVGGNVSSGLGGGEKAVTAGEEGDDDGGGGSSVPTTAQRLLPRQSAVAALVIEPVCSQTGDALNTPRAAALRRVCDRYSVPIIADETRCGLGRAGETLSSPAVGLAADAITIGEALGGGFASVAAVLFDTRAAAFGKRGAFPSTATMANDNLGSHIGLATVAHVVAQASVTRAAAQRCQAALETALAPFATDKGGADEGGADKGGADKGGAGGARAGVCDVRGHGLMLGVRFAARQLAPLAAESARRCPSDAGHDVLPLSLVLHAYLLRAHGVRVRPGYEGAAAPTQTSRAEEGGDDVEQRLPAAGDCHLMVDMPAVASDDSVARVAAALRSLAELLACGDAERILSDGGFGACPQC